MCVCLKSRNVDHRSSWYKRIATTDHFISPQPLRAVGVLFSPMVSGWAAGLAGGGKKFVWPVSRKP